MSHIETGAAAQMQPELPKKSDLPFAGMEDREILREYGSWHREEYLPTIPEEKQKMYSHGKFNNQRLIELLKNPRLFEQEAAAGPSTEAVMGKLFFDWWQSQRPQKAEEEQAA